MSATFLPVRRNALVILMSSQVLFACDAGPERAAASGTLQAPEATSAEARPEAAMADVTIGRAEAVAHAETVEPSRDATHIRDCPSPIETEPAPLDGGREVTQDVEPEPPVEDLAPQAPPDTATPS